MEQVKKKNVILIFCYTSGLITGFVIGMAVLSLIVSYRMDSYYHKNIALEDELQDKIAQLEKLENSIKTQTPPSTILKNIEINLIFNENEGDEIDKVAIDKTIMEKYSPLVGKEVENIDPDILAEVADKRILKIEDREYKLSVNKIILTETLKIWIKVEVTANE